MGGGNLPNFVAWGYKLLTVRGDTQVRQALNLAVSIPGQCLKRTAGIPLLIRNTVQTESAGCRERWVT